RRRNSDRPPPSASLTNSLTPSSGVGLLASPLAAGNPGRAARGSVVPRKVACRPAARGAGGDVSFAVQGHQFAHTGGAAWSLPLSNREQEWTPRHATLLCSLPVAVLRRLRLELGSRYFGFGLFVLGVVAVFGIAERRWG